MPLPAGPELLAGVRLVILDFDGVVADSEVISLATLQECFATRGVTMAMPDLRAAFLGTSLATIRAYLLEHGPKGSGAGFAEDWQGRLFERFRAELRPLPGLEALLDHLGAARLPFCVASSGTHERIGVALDAMGLAPRFAHVFSAQEVENGKPAPDLFLHAARQMDTPPQACLVIEDSPFGVRAAKAAGMRCVGYTGGTHLEGIRAEHEDVLRGAGADWVTETHTTLPAMGLAYDRPRA